MSKRAVYAGVHGMHDSYNQREASGDEPKPESYVRDYSARGYTRLPYEHLAVVNTLLDLALEKGLPSLLDEAPAAATRTLGLEYSEVMELLPDGTRLLLRGAVGWKEDLINRLTVEAVPGSRLEVALRTERPVVVENSRQGDRIGWTPEVSPGVLCGISATIGDSKSPFGVLGVHGSRPRTFMPEEIGFVQQIAGLIGKAAKSTVNSYPTEVAVSGGRLAVNKGTALEGVVSHEDLLTERTKKVRALHRMNLDIHITPAQWDTLCRMFPGKKAKDIAAEIGVSESTVRSHIYRLQKALDVANKHQILPRARELGLLDPPA